MHFLIFFIFYLFQYCNEFNIVKFNELNVQIKIAINVTIHKK